MTTMKLFLAEKPSQARSISTFLNATRKREGHFEGKGVVITWVFGHVANRCLSATT